MYLFFLYGSRAPRDLHSFPTRRSSDLDGTGSDRNAEHDKLTDDPPVAPRGATGGSSVSLSRSEEHTSELQSLRHLVCRLLLEKKKKKKYSKKEESHAY